MKILFSIINLHLLVINSTLSRKFFSQKRNEDESTKINRRYWERHRFSASSQPLKIHCNSSSSVNIQD